MADRFGLNLRLDGQPTIRARILQMALRQHGLTNHDAQVAFGITAANVTNQIGCLERRGMLQRLPREPGTRYRFQITDLGRTALAEAGFAQPFLLDADSPVQRINASEKQQKALSRAIGKPGRELVVPPKPASDAPVVIRGGREPKGRPIFPTGSTTTTGKAAGYDPRYQCAPGEQPWGAGFAAAGIGRDVTTGRGWR